MKQYIARNKKSGVTFEVTEEEKNRMLQHPMSRKKFIYTEKTSTPAPIEAKKIITEKKK